MTIGIGNVVVLQSIYVKDNLGSCEELKLKTIKIVYRAPHWEYVHLENAVEILQVCQKLIKPNLKSFSVATHFQFIR